MTYGPPGSLIELQLPQLILKTQVMLLQHFGDKIFFYLFGTRVDNFLVNYETIVNTGIDSIHEFTYYP